MAPRVRNAEHEFDPDPSGAQYDDELTSLIHIAAAIGGDPYESAEVSLNELLIATLRADDASSRWLQTYVHDADLDLRTLYSRAGFDLSLISQTTDVLTASPPPDFQRALSGGMTELLGRARRFADESAATRDNDASSPNAIGVRHLLAALAFGGEGEARALFREWGIRDLEFQPALLRFLESRYSLEDWTHLQRHSDLPRPASPLVGRYTADDPYGSVDDHLDIENEATAFARIAASREIRPPLAIGVFGEWGSGKTYFMRRIHDYIERMKRISIWGEPSSMFHQDVVQIRFDAWHYVETNLWASLVECIFSALDRHLLAQSEQAPANSERIFEHLSTARQLKLEALEEMIACRAEKCGAEIRAKDARRGYETALARAELAQPGSYLTAMLKTFLADPNNKKNLKEISTQLGLDALHESSGRLTEVLSQAKSEVGRARLLNGSMVRLMGKPSWLFACFLVLLVFPIGAELLVGLAAKELHWMTSLSNGIAAATTLLTGVAITLGSVSRVASDAMNKLDVFRERIEEEIQKQRAAAVDSTVAHAALGAEADLASCKQALQAAERALSEAEARFATARRDFESTSARSRLSAFIHSKATDGSYARHLGIIAAIRRDFAQLAALISRATDEDAGQSIERARASAATKERIRAFLQRLTQMENAALTSAELRGLFALLDAKEAAECFESWRKDFPACFKEADGDLEAMLKELKAVAATPLPLVSRVILYIDDLDRCPPGKVVEVLQAVHLLLGFPLFVVIAAVDARWVSRSLEVHYPSLLRKEGTEDALASAHDYMEKIFQIPYWVRRMDQAAAEKYVLSLSQRDLAPSARGSSASDLVEARDVENASLMHRIPSNNHEDAQPDDTADDPVAQSPPMRAVPAAQAEVMMLRRREIDTLALFASRVADTPRRAIRFVNVYRLIKASMTTDQRELLEGDKSEAGLYSVLIAELAIVAAAPLALPRFFRALDRCTPEASLDELATLFREDQTSPATPDSAKLLAIIELLNNHNTYDTRVTSSTIRAKHLKTFSTVARRYSFTAPPS